MSYCNCRFCQRVNPIGEDLTDALIHGLIITEHNEFMCADPSNPKYARSLIDLSNVEIFANELDWYGVSRWELMARYQDQIYEINLCEHCLEAIICHLVRPKKGGLLQDDPSILLAYLRYMTEAQARGHHRAMVFIASPHKITAYSWEEWFEKELAAFVESRHFDSLA